MSSAESFFMDDPFFANSHFLWPRCSMALSSFKEDFLHRKAQIMQNLRNEIRDSLLNELTDEFFQCLDGQRSISRLFSLINTDQNKRRDVSLTLDTQGFSPEDVTVTLSGRTKLSYLGSRLKPYVFFHGQTQQLGGRPASPSSIKSRVGLSLLLCFASLS
ncbi:hypothetical protein cypCar_00032333 [Cyprinus carpio]|nr:hypothetical protein cypCar_00032333 [Cyprinus carpio]